MLGYPYPQQPYILDSDASAHGVGTMLSQIQGWKIVIVYNRKTLSLAERNYCVVCKELLAVVKGMKHFQPN